MSGNAAVIDNEKVVFLDQLKEILPETKRASIAVGYFFISGFAEIMGSLERMERSPDPSHMLRLLISPTTNRKTAEALLAENETFAEARKAGEAEGDEDETRRKASDEVKRTLEHMPQTEKDQTASVKLVALIRKKKLQVKVYTKDQLHAKAYIFEIERGLIPIMAIVGSSNLSLSGIKEHAELNLRTNDDGQSRQLLDWFDRHWNDPSSIEFTEDVADILDRSWAGKERTPSDIYRKAALYEHDDQLAVPIPHFPARDLFEFQKAAVYRAIRRLDEYGGVIIADVVGTGKSFIGSAVLKHLRESKRSKPLIICPPHLKDMWRDYLREFELHGEIESRYKIGMEDILSKYAHCDAILVDESHNFRNSNTNSYAALLAYMEEKADDAYMIMLSATPISNGPTDLKNQLKLFPSGRIASIPPLSDTTLDEYFKGVMDGTRITDEGAERIRELLRHILIRRTRTQIMKKYAKRDGDRYYLEKDGERMYFPKRRLKHPEEYDVNKVYNNSFDEIQDAIRKLKLARYAPGNYIREAYLEPTHPEYKKYQDLMSTTLPLIGIVRTSLLKRMESSIAAFADSVERYLKGYKEFKRILTNGVVPVGKEFHDEIYKKISSDQDDYDDSDLSRIESQYEIGAFDVKRWKADMAHDVNVFASIKGNLVDKSEFTRYDDKLHKLLDLVRKMKAEKILIFTESAVTARYIHAYLDSEIKREADNRKIEEIDSKKGSREKNVLVRRFDPKNNNAMGMAKKDEIDVLVSTDVLSEGVNLQAGRVVINYDFHWNPVRLIQRVGRVDRIGTEHETIDIINFLPTAEIDSVLSLRERVAAKIETIREIIGHDQKILEATEVIDAEGVADIYDGDEDVLDQEDGGLLNTETESERQADQIREDKTELLRIQGMPFGIRSSAGSGRLLIACEAQEETVNNMGDVVSTRTFRRHYEVLGGRCRRVFPLSFLKQIGEHARDTPSPESAEYNRMVSVAWKEFERDAKNSAAKIKPLKHQKYFEEKLRRIAEDPILGRRAMGLMPFIRGRMMINHQPYPKLAALSKDIDRDASTNDETVVSRLETIRKNYSITYRKRNRKPKILYSMMVRFP